MSRSTFGAILILAVGAALRLAFLTDQSLWYDEGFSLVYSEGSLVEAITRIVAAPGSDRYQPLYYLVLLAWRAVAGSSEVALRLLSVGLGVVTLGVLHLVAREHFGPRRAIWSLALLATSAPAVFYSQEVRPYMLMLFLATLQLLMFLRSMRPEPRATTRVAFVIVNCFAFLTSVLMMVYATALALADLLRTRSFNPVVRRWLPTAIASLPIVSYYLHAFRVRPEGSISSTASIVPNLAYVPFGLLAGTTYGPPQEALRGADRLGVALSYWPELVALALVVLLLSFCFAALWRSGDWGRSSLDRMLLGTLLAGFGLGVVFALVSRLNWLPRHALYLLVPFVLLAPAIIEGRRRWLEATALIALMGINLFSIANYYVDERYARDDYRGAAAYLTMARGADGASVLLWGLPALLAYYGDPETIDGRGLSREGLGSAIERVTKSAPRVAVAINRAFYWDSDGSARLDRSLTGRYVLEDARTLPYFDLRTYRLAGPSN